ncbi:hypothetical protein [Rahnella aceris]
MTKPKTSDENAPPAELEADAKRLMSCFIIMPIADIPGYEPGHFLRVYHHVIKPACEIAGFNPVRADDVNSSHMIVVDILKKIVESDLAICDLSGRNPNVLYELGLRQAFNKKTVLIKDNKTENIFDVQGFRHTQYDNSLRIDNVKSEIQKLALAITETYNANGDINSIVQLLEIEPAKIEAKTELSASDTVIFRTLNDLIKKVDGLSNNFGQDNNETAGRYLRQLKIGNTDFIVGNTYYRINTGGKIFGTLQQIDVQRKILIFENPAGSVLTVPISSKISEMIDEIPF